MNSEVGSREVKDILTLIEEAGEPLSISQVEALLPYEISRRTLLRRLHELQLLGKIKSNGQKRAVKYSSIQNDLVVPLTNKAIQLQAAVSQPLSKRTPVAYQQAFLHDYVPNKTFYLPEKMRKRLMKIGQAFVKPLEPGTYGQRILHKLLIDLSWNSSRLEGNTYSLLETERLIEFGAEAEGKNAFEAQMILNHKEAIQFMIEQVGQPHIDKSVLLNIHALLSNNLLVNPKARGSLRQIPVGISRTVYHPPEVPQVINENFQMIVTKGNQIKDPIEQSFFFLVQIPYLQPFEDVNKRVSRLISNVPLLKNNLTPLSFIDVPMDVYINGLLAIYELNRVDLLREVYDWAYERSSKKYKVVLDTLNMPNMLVMKFKRQLKAVIQEAITGNFRGHDLIVMIADWTSKYIEKEAQLEFKKLVETELASLHEGNISIYSISSSDFKQWKN